MLNEWLVPLRRLTGQPLSNKTSKMNKENAYFAATSVLHVSGENGERPTLESSTIELNFSSNIDQSMYYIEGKLGSPNAAGVVVLIDAFVHGLATTIRHAHGHKYFDESDLVRDTIRKIGEAFAIPVNQTTTSNPYEHPNQGA